MTKTKKSAPTTRCAIYCRKSTEDGLEQEFNSLDAQREAGEAYIRSLKTEGWECLATQYSDGGFSGGNMDRPGLRQLLADIEAGEIDCVVVYKVDRLSRSLLDFARMMEAFEKHNVSFVSVTQQFNTTHSMGRLTLNVLLSFAQFEREIIGERIRDKIAAQARRGRWTGGRPVLGYDVDRSGPSPKLVLNPDEATRVREIFDLYVRLGSLFPVLEELESRQWRNKGWTTKKGQRIAAPKFDRSNLYSLLCNPIYLGKIKHKSQIYDGIHEPIISEEVFGKVQQQMQQNRRRGGADVRNRHGALLRGVLFCKACNRAMTHTFTSKNGVTRYRYYTCVGAIKNGRRSCPSRSLSAPVIEKAIVEQLREIAKSPALREEILNQSEESVSASISAIQKERKQLSRQVAAHHASIRRLATTDRVMPESTDMIAELHDRVDRAEKRLAELDQQLHEHDSERLTWRDIDAALANFEDVWDTLSTHERCRALAQIVRRVEYDVQDSSISIEFHEDAFGALSLG